jgi:hypothetical protein
VAAIIERARVAVRRSEEIRMVFLRVSFGGAGMAASRRKTYARRASAIILDVPQAVFGPTEE